MHLPRRGGSFKVLGTQRQHHARQTNMTRALDPSFARTCVAIRSECDAMDAARGYPHVHVPRHEKPCAIARVKLLQQRSARRWHDVSPRYSLRRPCPKEGSDFSTSMSCGFVFPWSTNDHTSGMHRSHDSRHQVQAGESNKRMEDLHPRAATVSTCDRLPHESPKNHSIN